MPIYFNGKLGTPEDTFAVAIAYVAGCDRL